MNNRKHIDFEIILETVDKDIRETYTASSFMRNLNFGGKIFYVSNEENLKENREVIAIRTPEARSYLVTIHFYNARKFPAPLTHATIKLLKVNPYKEEYTKKLFFSEEGQELTAFKFRVDYNGIVHVKPSNELIVEGEVIRKKGGV